MRVLVIDDSAVGRAALRMYLAPLRCEIFQAVDGMDALSKLAEHWPIDVATVDWDMPRMTGVEFVEATRRLEEFNGLKLLMVTALNSRDQVARALRAGADEYLMKPVTREMIAEKFVLMGLLAPEEAISPEENFT